MQGEHGASRTFRQSFVVKDIVRVLLISYTYVYICIVQTNSLQLDKLQFLAEVAFFKIWEDIPTEDFQFISLRNLETKYQADVIYFFGKKIYEKSNNFIFKILKLFILELAVFVFHLQKPLSHPVNEIEKCFSDQWVRQSIMDLLTKFIVCNSFHPEVFFLKLRTFVEKQQKNYQHAKAKRYHIILRYVNLIPS